MSQLREIKRRIKSVNNIAQVTYAMQLVAASRMKKAQDAAEQGKIYMATLKRMLARIARSAGPSPDSLLNNRTGVNTLLIIYSPQRGLAGSLPGNMLRFTLEQIKNVQREGGSTTVVTVGRKVRDQLVRRGVKIEADFSDAPEKMTTADVRPLVRLIEELYTTGQVDRVTLIYPEFLSALVQRPRADILLPIDTDALQSEDQIDTTAPFTFEPSEVSVVNELVPLFLETVIYQARLETVASEYSARMMAMRNATDNASEVKDALTLEYNKSRQAQITTELAEISAGTMEATI